MPVITLVVRNLSSVNLYFCSTDDAGAVFKHTQLLFKFGSEADAINNWLEFRGIKFHQKEELSSIKKTLRYDNVYQQSEIYLKVRR